MRTEKLINGDCLIELDKLIADRIKADAVITSPPYNMCLKVQNNKYVSRWKSSFSNENHLSNKYKNYNDDLSMDDYFNFQRQFIEKSLKISDYVFYNIQMITGNKIALCKLINEFSENLKDVIIWDKEYSEPSINKGVLNSQFEFIFCFSNIRPKCRTFDNAQFPRGGGK